MHIFAWKSRHNFSFSLQWPGGSTQWLGLLSIGFGYTLSDTCVQIGIVCDAVVLFCIDRWLAMSAPGEACEKVVPQGRDSWHYYSKIVSQVNIVVFHWFWLTSVYYMVKSCHKWTSLFSFDIWFVYSTPRFPTRLPIFTCWWQIISYFYVWFADKISFANTRIALPQHHNGD